MLDVRRMVIVSDVFVFAFFMVDVALEVWSGRKGRAVWAEYKKPSGGLPEGFKDWNTM